MSERPEGHRPVMLEETLQVLDPQPGDRVVDGTLGLGGHSLALLNHVTKGHLLGIERDPWVLRQARERFEREVPGGLDRITLVQGSYADVGRHVDAACLGGVDALLLDLGLNSVQIDRGERGFKREDDSLDLRFDTEDEMTETAATLLAKRPAEEIADLLFHLGGERLSRPISRAIVRRREEGRPVETSQQLADLVSGIYHRKGIRRQRIHPVTRTTQALRMAVNDELSHLERGLRGGLKCLSVGGRMAVISFHSGEARVVKRIFTESVKGTDEEMPEGVEFQWIDRRVTKPSREETLDNPRSRSAQLRALRRVA